MTKLLFLLLQVFPFALLAQRTPEIDSLENSLSKHTREDLQKITLLYDLAYAYMNVDAQAGLNYANQMLELAGKLNNPVESANAKTARGNNLSILGKDSLAVLDYKTAASQLTESGEELRAAIPLANLALLYNKIGRYKEALEIYQESLEIFEKHNRPEKVQGVLNGMGITYFYLGDYLSAIEHYNKTLDIAISLQDVRFQAHVYNNLALIYKRLGRPQQALEQYKEAEKTAKELNDNILLTDVLGNMASVYTDIGNNPKAKETNLTSLEVARTAGYKRGEASSLSNLAVSYFEDKDYIQSMEHFNQALDIYRDAPNLSILALIYNYQSRILTVASDADLGKIGFDPKTKLNNAEELALKSLNISEETENPFRKEMALHNLSVIYQKQHRFQDALSAYQNHVALKDSLSGVEKKEEIVRLEMQHEMERKEAEASAEIQRHKTSRNTIILISMLLATLGLSLFFFYKRWQDAIKQQQQLAFKATLAETDMKVLRLQMNPHFIFNSLNSISDYIRKNDTKSADYYLTKFAKLIREILESAEASVIPLSEELNMLKLYMDLEAARLNDKFTYDVNVADDIDPEEVYVPPLILQPFVENSIWHGLAKKGGKGKITIEVNRENDMFNYVVEDDGVGRVINHNHKDGKKSFGLKITKERIELLNKLQNLNASVNIIDLTQGTRVEVKLPLNHDQSHNY